MNYTYVLECSDGTYYCGWTNDLEKRLYAHNSGKGAKYTKSRLPVKLIYFEEYETKEEAMSREWHIKRLSRADKERLIDSTVFVNDNIESYLKDLSLIEEQHPQTIGYRRSAKSFKSCSVCIKV